MLEFTNKEWWHHMGYIEWTCINGEYLYFNDFKKRNASSGIHFGRGAICALRTLQNGDPIF
jgi:hypothetical protein